MVDLPAHDPVQVLDPAEPASIGAMVGPEAFTEVRFLAHYKQTLALKLIPEFSDEFKKAFGRDSPAVANLPGRGCRHAGSRDGFGVRHDQGYHRRDARRRHSHRPRRHRLVPAVPGRRLRNALAGAKDVVVVEKSIAVGMGGQLANNVDVALRNLPERRGCTRRWPASAAAPSPARRCIMCSGRPACNRGRARISST